MKESAVFGGWNIECIVILIFFLTVFIKTDLKKFLLFTIDQLQNKKSKIGINNTDKEFAVFISILSKEMLMISMQYNLWGWFFYFDLNFKHNITSLKTKLSRALFALRSVQNTLNQNSLPLLYNSLFHWLLLSAGQILSCSRSGPIKNLFVKFKKNQQYTSFLDPYIMPKRSQYLKNFNITIAGFNLILETTIHSNLIRLDSFLLYNFPKIWQDFPNDQIKILCKTTEFNRNPK